MKLTLILISVVSLLLLHARIQRLPQVEIPFFMGTYLYVQASFTVFATVIGLRIGWASRAYENIFYFCLAVTLIAAMILAFSLLKPVPWMGFSAIIFISLMLAFLVPWLAVDAMNAKVSMLLLKQVGSCSVYLFCGTAVLLSLFYPGGRASDLIRLFVGLFWLAIAAYGFFCQIATIRNKTIWIHQTELVPTVLAIVFFLSLTWQLGKGQLELSRQPSATIFPQCIEECNSPILARSINAEYPGHSELEIRQAT